MSDEAKHTETPQQGWTYSVDAETGALRTLYFVDDDGCELDVAVFEDGWDTDELKGMADAVVRAANIHDRLVDTVESLLAVLGDLEGDEINEAKAILREAKGQKEV